MTTTEDTVTGLIKECHRSRERAEELFSGVAAGRRQVHLAGEKITLSEEEVGEFVARYSAEVEPVLWESKRRKDQI